MTARDLYAILDDAAVHELGDIAAARRELDRMIADGLQALVRIGELELELAALRGLLDAVEIAVDDIAGELAAPVAPDVCTILRARVDGLRAALAVTR